MSEKPLGIYYLDYAPVPYPRMRRKMILGYERKQFLEAIKSANIQDDWFCWLSECRTPFYLVEGNIEKVSVWIDRHIPDKFGDPLNE